MLLPTQCPVNSPAAVNCFLMYPATLLSSRARGERLLSGRVPHRHEEYEPRVDGSCQQAEQKAVGGDAGEGRTGWGSQEHDAPGDGGQR